MEKCSLVFTLFVLNIYLFAWYTCSWLSVFKINPLFAETTKQKTTEIVNITEIVPEGV